MSKQIVFEPIKFEDPSQKEKTQYTTTVNVIEDGKKIQPDEETEFVHFDWSTLASLKFNKPDQRDWLKVEINPNQPGCLELEKLINTYDDALDKNRLVVFGEKFNKLYTHARSIKTPKEKDELDMEAVDPDKVQKPKYKYLKLKLDMMWNYYLIESNERLDKKNTGIVRKTVIEALTKSKGDKSVIPNLSFTLTFTDEENKTVKKLVKMSELESRKEVNTKIFHRRVENLPEDTKKVIDCTEDELEQIYGNAELQDIRTFEDIDSIWKPNSYLRFIIKPKKIWAHKKKNDDGKREFSIQWVAISIDMIHIRTSIGNQNIRKQYSNFSFGKKNKMNDLLINSSADEMPSSVFDVTSKLKQSKVESDEDDDEEEEKPQLKSKVKQTKVESDNEESAEESEEESAEESEEESEDDDEPVIVKKGKGKTVVTKEKTKSTKPVKRSK